MTLLVVYTIFLKQNLIVPNCHDYIAVKCDRVWWIRFVEMIETLAMEGKIKFMYACTWPK